MLSASNRLSRRWRARTYPVFAGAILLGAVVGCNSAPAPTPQPTVRGILLEVDAPSLTQLNTFSLRDDTGRIWEFRAAADFNVGATHPMTPGHMRQHMALADAITVTYRADGDTLIALDATDATN